MKAEQKQPAIAAGLALTPEQLRGLRNLQRGVGEAAMFLAAHPKYGGMFLSDLLREVLPAVLYGQYRIVRNNKERTLGYVAWAKIGEAVFERIKGGASKLRREEWAGGNKAVVMTLAAQTKAAEARIMEEIKREFFADEPLWLAGRDSGGALQLRPYLPEGNVDG